LLTQDIKDNLLPEKAGAVFVDLTAAYDTGIVAIGNPERQVRKASHCGSKPQ